MSWIPARGRASCGRLRVAAIVMVGTGLFGVAPLSRWRGAGLFAARRGRMAGPVPGPASSCDEQEEWWVTRQRYRALMDNTILGVAFMDSGYRILEVNKKFSEMFKKVPDAFVGNHCYTDFEKREAVCPHCPGARAMESGGSTEVQTQGVLDDGTTFHAWNRAFPIRGRTGQIVGFAEVVEDVTRQKVAEEGLRAAYEELRRLQDKLVQSEKLASIGRLAAGVAHEINTPTAYIAMNLQALKTYVDGMVSLLLRFPDLHEAVVSGNATDAQRVSAEIAAISEAIELDLVLDDSPRAVDSSLEGAVRITAVVNALKSYTENPGEQCCDVDVNEVITSSLAIARGGFADGCVLRTELSAVPHVWGDPAQLRQALVSLVVNAGRAVGGHGTVTVRSREQDGDVLVEVSDTGKGIEPEHLGRVFDPFFTTEEVGKGAPDWGSGTLTPSSSASAATSP